MKALDGTINWMGGMDASRLSYLIGDSLYHKGCNVKIDRVNGQLSQRHGLECVSLIGDADAICIYNNAKNIQAEGYYKSNNKYTLLRLVDGWILEFKPVTQSIYSVSVCNPEDRRNATISKGWIITVPRGAIVNDGLGLPHIVRAESIRRSKPELDEIGVGRMGVYLQNRLFYVDANGKLIWASNFRNPESLSEAKISNLWGFMLPSDEDLITAIGNRRQSLNYVEGGSLSFSTINSTYSVDVRGDRQNWEEGNATLGKVQESLPGIGAVSSYSYESFASNLYFRSIEDGIVDLYSTEDQFGRGQAYAGQSNEVLNWLNKDTRRLLSKCYSRKFGHRLFTTVGAEVNKHGYIYWNGLLSMVPEPTYSNQRHPTVYEGLITGVRPWCMTSFRDENNGSELLIDSYDQDGVTRLYRLNVKLDYDLNHRGEKIEIESWVDTKSYFFDEIAAVKQTESRGYTLVDIPRNLKVKVFSRTETSGPWASFFSGEHFVPRSKTAFNDMNISIFRPIGSNSQDRINYKLPKEKADSQGQSFSGLSGDFFYSRQYRLEFKGAFSLGHFIVKAAPEKMDLSPSAKEEKNKEKISRQEEKLDYTYSIASSYE